MNWLQKISGTKEKVFVYETLLKYSIWKQVIGHLCPHKKAILNGYKEVSVDISPSKRNYHTVVKKPGHVTQGEIYQISRSELNKLDNWESDYDRIKVHTNHGEAYVYKLKDKFCKTAMTDPLRGEWFIDSSGYATFADGDIGDYNHESYALQSKIPEELWERYDNGRLTKKQRKEIGEEFLQYMEKGGEARQWMVEREGWIRVHGSNFELFKLTEQQLDNITDFISEELSTYGDEPEEDFDIYIEEISTGKTYDFSVQQLFSTQSQPGGLARLLMRGNAAYDPGMRLQQETDQNNHNQLMSEVLNMIQTVKTTLGMERYKYISNKLSGKSLPEQKSIMSKVVSMIPQLTNANDVDYQNMLINIF